MKTIRDFRPLSDRYSFDFGPCSSANGFAQIDTKQDAPYFGGWCAPATRTIVNFSEGDLTTTVCETDAEFADHLRELAKWNAEAGYGPMKIDPGRDEGLRQAFENLGIARANFCSSLPPVRFLFNLLIVNQFFNRLSRI